MAAVSGMGIGFVNSMQTAAMMTIWFYIFQKQESKQPVVDFLLFHKKMEGGYIIMRLNIPPIAGG